jgi:hypothetical protein
VHGVLVARVLTLRRGMEAPHRRAAPRRETASQPLKSANPAGPAARNSTARLWSRLENGVRARSCLRRGEAAARAVAAMRVSKGYERIWAGGAGSEDGVAEAAWASGGGCSSLASSGDLARRGESGRAGERRRRGGDWLVWEGSGSGPDSGGRTGRAHASKRRAQPRETRRGRRRAADPRSLAPASGQGLAPPPPPPPLPALARGQSSATPAHVRVPFDPSSTGEEAKTCGEKGARDEPARRHERFGTRQRNRADPPPPRGAGLAVLFSASHPSLAWTRLARNNGQEVARGNLGGHSTRLGRGSHHTHCDGRRRLGPLVGYSAGIICVGSAPETEFARVLV